MMLTKVHEGGIKQLNEQGEGIAVIATLNVLDRTGDVTRPGAFGEQVAPMVFSHDWTSRPPIGKATIREEDDEARAHFRLNLKTEGGREVYEALKFDMEQAPAKQQWSYGYSVKDAEDGVFDNQRVRFLKSLMVHEVSPVLLGAGIETRTVALKGLWLTVAEVAKMCPPCAEKMHERHITKIRLGELIKQGGFTCPKPFATFEECVERFRTEPDVADPEAFCAAWEAFCGERAAAGDGHKTMADQVAATLAVVESTIQRWEEINELRLKDGRALSTAHKAKAAELVERLNRIVQAPSPQEVARRYFDLKVRTIKGLDLP